ncbi:MAG: SPL family radical SAM protein [Thermodesulfobacteriota bacterium]
MEEAPTRIYIEKHIADYPLTKKIVSRLKDVPVSYVEDYKTIGLEKPFETRADEDKNALALAEKKGDVIKNIGRMDEGQYYLFHEIDCKYDCEYCYLQYYFQTKVPVIFVNRDVVLAEIEKILKTRQNAYFHVGEVCDSLAFDYLTDFSKDIANLFIGYKNGTVEFRTKSTNVHNLLEIDSPPSNLIPSWTMSPEHINNTVEHKTPGLDNRIEAAKKCQDYGYTVGIRLDPIFNYKGWESDYREMVEKILTELVHDKIDYITLGTVKMHKNLIDAVYKRFPETRIMREELIPAGDGKFRPIKFDRVKIYRSMTDWIKNLAPEIRIDLSIETEEVRELVFNE